MGVDVVEVKLALSVMSKDWVVLVYEARTKFTTLRPRIVFTEGDPAKALEEVEKVFWSGGP
ncbi:MAG: hypothetical protein QW677_06570 [Pyrobaculum sp.]|uniref:Uncharacterized protein n=1 Tax=Pyrobaculum arsenaticum (strain DSM 13514 / JCM 11321 / PZ6) TaxID=340102 RepID=A4WJ77_PYRAR|nr:hypothetical protein Pars_0859 [Pyrobaculum arsenaticum DSM 13514]